MDAFFWEYSGIGRHEIDAHCVHLWKYYVSAHVRQNEPNTIYGR